MLIFIPLTLCGAARRVWNKKEDVASSEIPLPLHSSEVGPWGQEGQKGGTWQCYKGSWRRSYVTRGCQCWGVLCGHHGCVGLQLWLMASPMWWSLNGMCGMQFFWGGAPL